MKDIVILVADKNMEFAVQGLLTRTESLEIRHSITYEIIVHPKRDPGCYRNSYDLMRIKRSYFKYVIVIFDKDGCGRENEEISDIENKVLHDLTQNGWSEDNAAVIVIDPELEVWVWSDSPEVKRCLGWKNELGDIRSWLTDNELWPETEIKPPDPKEAYERALKEVGKPKSSSIFKELAENVSFKRCSDSSFAKLKNTLQNWFPIN